ncbi:uncharacterized protein LOC128966471 [Oppia nitens]|uniref:uncharacterized protein LOC128966471 n=1 Tax=Oppia nitens TaxID=1686743 RepID=UPI0023DAB73A|nr:uncharacterized protein LOC128966471 [Oppia nitens]
MNFNSVLVIVIILVTFLPLYESRSESRLLDQNKENVINGESRAGGLFNIGGVISQFWKTVYLNRGFNSSFVLLLPLSTVTIPGYGRGIEHQSPLSALNIGNISIVGIIIFGTIALWAPFLFPNINPNIGRNFDNYPDLETIPEFLAKRLLSLTEHIIGHSIDINNKDIKVKNFLLSRLQSLVELLMSFVDQLIDDIPEYPGLDPQECIKRCICETHKHRNQFGLIGRVVRFLFRPYNESIRNLKVKSKYRLAANYGIKEESIECQNRYNKCELNFVHLIHNVINFLF